MGPVIALVALAYLSGSLSSAVLVCRLLHQGDPREVGSRNPGATNVLRHFGRGAAALTLAGDVLKGYAPVLLGAWLGLDQSVLTLIGAAAFLGHLYPVFFGFRGGKGVATYTGALFGIDWAIGVTFVAVWVVMAALFRYSSLSGLVAAAASPFAAAVLGMPPAGIAGVSAMVVLLVWRHRDNIRNLLAGRESKLGTHGRRGAVRR
ncbi:MAG: glycerol-3-phosphate 1-O-acyltransferase PlsY [Gammaproteobacteria bacterium]|nr:glycerol-3-phosphate 1-O-acyltransferase PlsY [Gammaproteobacteria bacterium]